MSDYLATADVWTVLDLIVAEFTSDPMSVQCFDLRLVERAKELNRKRALLDTASPDLLAALKRFMLHDESAVHLGEWPCEEYRLAEAAIAKAEGRR